MKITKAKFLISVPSLRDCPVLNLPEFPLVGRSNVGKSSFINALVNIKGLAKTSNTPGKTKLINFFNINDKFIFADLPGYGFAKADFKTQNLWQKNLEQYLLNRKSIVCLIHFIDSRHPVQKNDLIMADWIKYNKLTSFVIAAKTDQIPKYKIQTVCKNFEDTLNSEVLPFSKSNNLYNDKIFDKLNSFIS